MCKGNNCFCRCGSAKNVPQNIVEDDIISEDVFACTSRNRLYYRIILTASHLILQDVNDESLLEQFAIEDMFGCSTTWDIESNSAAYIYFYFYPKSKRKNLVSNINYRQKLNLIFEIHKVGNSREENMKIANSWRYDVLNILGVKYPEGQVHSSDHSTDTPELNLASTSHLFSRKFLIVLNPKSGQGKSIDIFERKVAPILKEFGISVEVLIPQHAGHAREKMSSADLSEFNGIVTIGGDGILYEVVNGLRCRKDAKIVSNIPIGIIAGGSGNGLARSIAEYSGESEEYLRNPILSTTLAAIRGNVKKVNLAEIDLDGKTIYSFLSVGCGLLADIDIESEVLRALGEPRFTIWSLYRIAKLRSYEAKLSYIPFDQKQEDQVNEHDENELPIISSSSSDSIVMKEDFVCIYASYQSFIGSDLRFAPTATFNDGTIHLTYMLKDIGRVKATQFLTSIDKGTHLDVKGVKYIKVKQFTIERDGGIEGNPTIDGELVSGNRICVQISSSPLNVFTL